ncbi:MAG: DUF2330 domain-containing protein [Sandaracinaceae bacterium]|nr:DUF2330 domain-containing protein [Sandaracinaceae bacterium]
MSSRLVFITSLLTSVASAWVVAPAPARACGGFFCSAQAPVNQAAERIIFADHGDGTVTAVVQVQYSGPSESFAWVLPVPGIPEVEVSSDLAFNRLMAVSNPLYLMNTTVDGVCRQPRSDSPTTTFATTSPQFFADAGVGPPVTVVAAGNVGPYEYEVIQLDPSTERPGDVAIAWLGDNGYDVDSLGGSSLGSYLLMGMNLIAFRLTKGNSAGTIRPIRIRYAASCPMVPIRPTAVAAEDDMGVLVWVLGSSRAVPTNYLSLELNEAVLDWTLGAPNYNDVVTMAANEAGGQGFVTEHAVPSDGVYRGAVFRAVEEPTIAAILSEPSSRTLIANLINQYVGWDGLAEVIAPWFVEEVDAQALIAQCQFSCDASAIPEVVSMDETQRQALLAALEAQVIAPMRATQALFDGSAYVTRLYTTLSASEMTLDPTFDFNPGLPSVNNVHMADRVIFCGPDHSFQTAPWLARLPNGEQVRGEGFRWPYTAGVDLPAMRKATQLATAGSGVVMQDQSALIDERLARDGAITLRPSRDTCQAGHPSRSLAGMASLGLVALALVARRRRPLP